ncbi:MAG: radical SAM protein [Bacteroidales bacterium]|nr:radical SAM protein [Bacteroidales bacterium]
MKKDLIILFHPAIKNQYYKCIPYSILSLERMIRDLNTEVLIIDENSQPEYVKIIEKNKDRLLFAGVSSIIGSQILGGIAFAKFIKSLNENNVVVWGGWHSTILPEQTLKESYIDYIITGQGEKAFREFTIAFINGYSLENIKNLCFKKDKQIFINEREDFYDCTTLPPLNYELVNINNYIYYPSFAKKSIVYFASSGCPFNCNFCAMATVYQQKWIPGKIEQIISDIKYFKENAGIDSIFFQDDNFFSNKQYALALCKAFISENLNITWETWTHAGGFIRMFNDEDISLFYKAGCRQIISGSESGSQQVLDLVNKKLSVEDNYTFVRLLKKHDITPFFSIMLCFPKEPEKEIDATFEMIRKAKLIDNKLKIYFSFYTPYPGTNMYKEAVNNGFQTPESLSDWAEHTFDDFRAPWWNNDYNKKLQLYAHFYIPFSNPINYRNFPRPPIVKTVLMLLNKLFYPIVIWRFKKNNFRYPIEASAFLFLLKLVNKVFKKNYKLYPF